MFSNLIGRRAAVQNCLRDVQAVERQVRIRETGAAAFEALRSDLLSDGQKCIEGTKGKKLRNLADRYTNNRTLGVTLGSLKRIPACVYGGVSSLSQRVIASAGSERVSWGHTCLTSLGKVPLLGRPFKALSGSVDGCTKVARQIKTLEIEVAGRVQVGSRSLLTHLQDQTKENEMLTTLKERSVEYIVQEVMSERSAIGQAFCDFAASALPDAFNFFSGINLEKYGGTIHKFLVQLSSSARLLANLSECSKGDFVIEMLKIMDTFFPELSAEQHQKLFNFIQSEISIEKNRDFSQLITPKYIIEFISKCIQSKTLSFVLEITDNKTDIKKIQNWMADALVSLGQEGLHGVAFAIDSLLRFQIPYTAGLINISKILNLKEYRCTKWIAKKILGWQFVQLAIQSFIIKHLKPKPVIDPNQWLSIRFLRFFSVSERVQDVVKGYFLISELKRESVESSKKEKEIRSDVSHLVERAVSTFYEPLKSHIVTRLEIDKVDAKITDTLQRGLQLIGEGVSHASGRHISTVIQSKVALVESVMRNPVDHFVSNFFSAMRDYKNPIPGLLGAASPADVLVE